MTTEVRTKHGELRFVDGLFGKIAPASFSKRNPIHFFAVYLSQHLNILVLPLEKFLSNSVSLYTWVHLVRTIDFLIYFNRVLVCKIFKFCNGDKN